MPAINRLPPALEDVPKLLARQKKAASRREMWRSVYQEVYDYCMPQRESWTWSAPGQRKNVHLYDSTGMEMTYLAANNAKELLFPDWKQWCALVPGAQIPKAERENPEVVAMLQDATDTLFSYLNHSNFGQVISECLLDLMAGTCSLTIDEGDLDEPFLFDSTPLSCLDLEPGSRGTVQTTFNARKPVARNIPGLLPGLELEGLPVALQTRIRERPDSEVELIQGIVYDEKTRKYFGMLIWPEGHEIIWRYDYEDSNPRIVARSSVLSGEVYGRGRCMLALPNIKTVNAMMRDFLQHAAMQINPPLTAVTDGILNPYTVRLVPNAVIAVNKVDQIQALDVGGNYRVAEAIMSDLRRSIRRIMLGDEMDKTGPVRSATEVAIADRNRLWNLGAEFGRIQAELAAPIIQRCVWILQKQGKIPPLKVDGRTITLKYSSPLSRGQDQEEIMALGQSLEVMGIAAQVTGQAGQMAIASGLKVESLPAWLAKRTGLDATLVRSEEEMQQMAQAAAEAAQAQGGMEGMA